LPLPAGRGRRSRPETDANRKSSHELLIFLAQKPDRQRHGGPPRTVLSTADGIYPEYFHPAGGSRRPGVGAAARARQHDARRLAQHLAEADALARAASIRSDRDRDDRGLGDGALTWSCSTAFIRRPVTTARQRSARASAVRNTICASRPMAP